MKKVVIYPGRFQPMLPHHAEVYKKLQATFPDADVYIATSDKVDGAKSPFNFKEKAEIMAQLHDIPTDKILIAPQPYLIDSYKNFNKQDTMVIFAVGEKDTDRFPMKNIDDNTGLDMTVRGEPRPKYYQMINTLKQHPALPMEERGYIYVAPNIEGKGEVASASAFRNAFTSVGSEQGQREVFEKYLGTFNEAIFALFKNKILGDNMKEDLDRLRKLAGMENLIEAPINFDDENDEIDDGDDYEDKPGFSQDNMINQLGKVIDSETAGKDAEEMKIKNFKPVTNVTTDDGATIDVTPAEAKALKNMFGMLSSARQGEEKSARERFNATIQTSKGLEQMLDFAKSKGLVKEEQQELPTLDLADIRSDYAVEEGDDEGAGGNKANGEDEDKSLEDKLKTEIAGLQRTIDNYKGQMAELEADPEFQQADDDDKDDYIFNATDGVEIRDQRDKLEFFKLTLADHLESGRTHWWQSEHGLYLDTAVRDEIAQELRDMGAWKGDTEESNEELNLLRKRAGLEVVQGDLEEGRVKDVLIDAQQMSKEEFDAKYNGEWNYDEILADYPVEQDESFDPAMEPNHADTEFERIYTAYENGGEPELAEYLGMSESELDQEMTEYAMEHGLHMDDDRDDVIQGYIEQLIDNADHKDMGAQMAQYESHLVQLRKLAGI